MPPEGTAPAGDGVAGQIAGIRDRWHTKRHPMFAALSAGKLELRVLGVYMAQHAKYVRLGLQAFGHMYVRGTADVRKMIVENMAEEEGLIAGPGEDREPHDHMDMIFRFCAAAGLTRDEILGVPMTAAWWGRALYYLHTTREEPLGVALAMQFTQEGQMPALTGEVVIPALERHYGYPRGAPEIEFFVEHEVADEDHSRRQLALASDYLDTPELQARAREVAEEMCRLRWACTTDTYRYWALGEEELLPPGVR